MTAGASPWAPDRRVLTLGLLGLITAAAFEGMAVPTVLPAMVDDLGGLDLYGWAFSVFWLTNIIGITLAGSDADRRGPARALAVGAVLFAAGMIVSGVAGGMPMVIAGRAIQGFGAGALGSVVYTAIARGYAPAARPRMIAFTSSAWVVPGLVGPALAGFLADSVGWRWVFLGMAPPVVVMALAVLPELRRLGAVQRAEAPVRSDTRLALDAVQLAVGSTLFLGALTVGSLPIGIAMAAVGVGLALLALRHLLPPGSLRLGRGRPSVFAACFTVAFAFFGTEAFVPLTIVEIRDSTTTIGGLALSAAAVSWATGSWLQARAAGAGIRRTLVVLGFVLIAVGIAVTSLILLPATPLPLAAVGWGIAGLGMGLAFSMLSLLVLETATPGEEGISSAGLQLMFTLGTAFGAGIGGAVVALAEDGHLGLSPALGVVNGGMLVVALLGLLIALRVPRRPTAAAATDLSGARPISFEHP
ncbi:MAG TPA: MFS transporter [Candidatus Limnocylindria bacterium]